MKQFIARIKTADHSQTKRVLVCWGICFCFLYFAYAVFLTPSVTSDLVSLYLSPRYPTLRMIRDMMSGGRFFATLIYCCWDYWLESFLGTQRLVQFLSILLFSIDATAVVFFFDRHGFHWKGMRVLFLVPFALICFLNPFSVQQFVYPGTTWGIGILMAILAADFFLKRRYVRSAIFLFLAMTTYQSYYAVFLILTLTGLYMTHEGKWSKACFLRMAGAFFCVAGVAVLCLLPVKIMSWTGVIASEVKQTSFAATDLWSKAKRIAHIALYFPLYLYGQWKYGLYPLLMSAFVLLGLAALWRKGVKWYHWVLLVLVVVANYACVFCFAVITDVYFPQRIVFTVFWALASAGLLLFFLCKDSSWKWLTPCMWFCTALCLLGNIFYTQVSITDYYISRSLDKEYVYSVQYEIEKYEAETGNTVEKIAVDTDEAPLYFQYRDLQLSYASLVYCGRTMYDFWADVEFLNLITHTSYKEIDMPQAKYDEYFAGKDWETYDPQQQLVFEGNTLYWCVY